MDLEEYHSLQRAKYAAFAETVASILTAALSHEPSLRLQHVQRRGKDPESLRRKLAHRGILDTTTLEAEIKDLAGCRLVFYTNSDVSRFLESGIVRDNFDIDWDRTKIHYPRPNVDQAKNLFISHNYVVKLKDHRSMLPEYSSFRDMWCEVQVQTTLNHARSEMAHDTIYKKPALEGFGGNLFQGIENRMQTIMREFLLPAGYEFQKVLDDFERLSAGKKLFDQGALNALADCDNNNSRYDVLQRFREYVLPYYDDLQIKYPEIRRQIIAAVKDARGTAAHSIETPFGVFSGHSVEQIVDIAADIFEYLRYVDVEGTFDAICELFLGARSDLERKRLIQSAQRLSEHELDVWKKAGPVVQSILVERIRSLDDDLLDPLRPVLLEVLGEVLKSEVTGTSSTYESVTIHRGSVQMSEVLGRARGEAIAILKKLYRKAGTDDERRAVIATLSKATATPHTGGYANTLLTTILDNTRDIVEFYTAIADVQSYEILQSLEHDLLWLYRRNQSMPADAATDPEVAKARDRLTKSVLTLRDRINLDRGFVVYKTLVGFNSVLAPAWESEEFDERAYRDQRIAILVEEVTDATTDDWLAILKRCSQTRSNDLMTFPSFGTFLTKLGEAKPQIVLHYLDRLDESPPIFCPGCCAVCQGVKASTR